MTDQTDNTDSGATADTPESLARDAEHQEALNNAHHPGHQAALERQCCAYGTFDDVIGPQKAEQTKAREKAEPLDVTHDPIAELAREAMGEEAEADSDADSTGDVADKPDLKGNALVAGLPDSARIEAEEAMAGIPQPLAQELAYEVHQARQRGAPSYEEGRQALVNELGEAEAERTIKRAQEALKVLPGRKVLADALKASGVGNDPAVIKQAARLANG